MTVSLILFFGSFIGITIMIGRKLLLLKNQPILVEKEVLIETPDFKEIRYVFINKTREYGYIILVGIIRFSIRSSRLLKRKCKEIKHKIKKIRNKKNVHQNTNEEIKEKEVSGFLKMISEYKYKIRKIKERVVEEEEENK